MIVAQAPSPTQAPGSAPQGVALDSARAASNGVPGDASTAEPLGDAIEDFGTQLTRYLAGVQDDAATTTDAAADGKPAESPSDPLVLVTTDASKAVDAHEDEHREEAPVDDATADLNAQLALVSQWAALARPATTPGSSTAEDTATAPAASDPLDIRGKLAAVRSGAGVEQAVARPGSREEPAIATVDPQVARRTDRATAADLVAKAIGDAARGGDTAASPTSVESAPTLATAALAATVARDLQPTSSANTVPVALHQSVGTPAWSQELGRAAIHIASDALQTASLRLNPANLGPLDVQVRVTDGVAHLNFHAAHADTRQAIEASRPALDQIFTNQGLTVGDWSVSDAPSRGDAFAADRSAPDQRGRERSGTPGDESTQGNDTDVQQAGRALAARLSRPLGMVDIFA